MAGGFKIDAEKGAVFGLACACISKETEQLIAGSLLKALSLFFPIRFHATIFSDNISLYFPISFQ